MKVYSYYFFLDWWKKVFADFFMKNKFSFVASELFLEKMKTGAKQWEWTRGVNL